MNIMQKPGPNLPNGTVQGAHRSDAETFTCSSPIWQEDVAIIPKVQGRPRKVNPA